MKAQDSYGAEFRRARLEAATRLARPEFGGLDAAAAAIGISTSALKKIELGERRPSFEVLEAMARAYGVLMGDLLPSTAPRGPQVDAILAPLALLPPLQREAFIVQMSAMARMLGSAITTTRQEAMRETTTNVDPHGVLSASHPQTTGHDLDAGVPTLSRAVEFEGTEEVSDAKSQRKVHDPNPKPAR